MVIGLGGALDSIETLLSRSLISRPEPPPDSIFAPEGIVILRRPPDSVTVSATSRRSSPITSMRAERMSISIEIGSPGRDSGMVMVSGCICAGPRAAAVPWPDPARRRRRAVRLPHDEVFCSAHKLLALADAQIAIERFDAERRAARSGRIPAACSMW